jgi:polygalacturonase
VAGEGGFRLVARLQDDNALAGAHDIEVRDGLAYLAGKGGSLSVVDVRTPAEPSLLWSARDPAACEDAETVLPLGPGRLLVGTRDALLFDTADPAQPRLQAKIEDRPRVDTINGFARIGDAVFAANKFGRVYVTAQTSHALVVLSVADAIARLADPRPDARARRPEGEGIEHAERVGVWDPREFGAKADGRTPDTRALQAAIDACAEAGGGRVVLHGGRYLAGTLRLKSNVILYLEAGATLVGSASVDDYPSLPSAYPTYTGEFVTGKMFLYAEDAHNIGIEGRGTIDGSGDAWAEGPYGFPSFHHRPRLLHFIGCENVQIRGVTFRNSGSWTLSFLECRDMLLEGFRIESRENPDIEAPRYDRVRGRNNDGIDLTDCERVRVANCFVNSGDDAICLKSLSPDKACRDITIVNCVVSSNASGIKIGTESAGAFEDIVVANCVVFDTRCEGLAVLTVDGARIERVSFSNITLRNIKGDAMLVRLGARNRTYRDGAGAKTGILRNVMFSGIQGARISSLGNAISGVPGRIIENVVLRDINLEFTGGGTAADARRAVPENETGYPGVKLFGTLPAYGFFVRHAKHVTMENIRLTFDEDDHRPAIVCDRVEDLSVSGLHARSMPGIEPMETR